MKVAIMGKLRSGKTTATNYLALQLGCEPMDFSDALKDAVAIMYPQNKEKKDRTLLQSVGQHMRKLDSDVWVNALLHKVNTSNYRNSVITGLRQENEHKALKENGYHIIKIECPQNIRVERALKSGDKMTKENLEHETEKKLDSLESDYTVTNDGNKYELYSKLDEIIADILIKDVKSKL